MIDRTSIRTPWREFVALSTADGDGRPLVTAAWFADEGPADVVGARSGTRSRSRQVPEVRTAVCGWLEGDLSALDAIAVETVGADFHVRVWRAMRGIPAGAVATYGEIASRVGAPRAARAVGTACASNTIALFVPCHRVVAANGVGGYGWRPELKVALLEHEGVDVGRLSGRSVVRKVRR